MDLRRKRKREASQKNARIARRDQTLPTDAMVYIEDGAFTPLELCKALRLAQTLCMTVSTGLTGSLLFVTRSCKTAEEATKWAAILLGGVLCDAAYFLSNASRGSALV